MNGEMDKEAANSQSNRENSLTWFYLEKKEDKELREDKKKTLCSGTG